MVEARESTDSGGPDPRVGNVIERWYDGFIWRLSFPAFLRMKYTRCATAGHPIAYPYLYSDPRWFCSCGQREGHGVDR